MTRGAVHIESTRCKGCGLCIAACPQRVLTRSPQMNAQGCYPVVLVEDAGACTGCALCALVCPDVVFKVYREPVAHARHKARTSGDAKRDGDAKREVLHARALEG